MNDGARVLFLCTANSARSQMAEGLLRDAANSAVHVASAGTAPGTLNPLAVEAMPELGIDISAQRSTPVDDVIDERYDYVITLCDDANESCPTFHNATHRLHWGLPDPALATGSHEERLATFRDVRDTIRQRIEELLPQLARLTARSARDST